ncbi:hypothetical protein ACOSYY_17660 [Nitrospira sp. BLG_2]
MGVKRDILLFYAGARAAGAALSRLSELTEEDWPKRDHLERLRLHYGRRRQRFAPSADVAPECKKETNKAFLRLRQETLTAERLALIRLRDEGTISDEVLHRLEQELDIEALRLGLGEQRVEERP